MRWRENGEFGKRAFRVKREAERFRDKVSAEVREGKPTQQYVRTSKTVADAWEQVRAADRIKRRKATTLARYDQMWASRVEPKWGSHRVQSVTTEEIDAWLGELLVLGLAYGTARKAVLVLSKAMKHAVARQWIVLNPCVGVSLAAQDDAAVAGHGDHREALMPADVERLADQMVEIPAYALLVRVAGFCGLRAAELAALRIKDVNLLRETIRIDRTVYYVDNAWVVDTPKSACSRRAVPILHKPLTGRVAELHLGASEPLRAGRAAVARTGQPWSP